MFGIMFTNREIKVSSIVPFKTSTNFGVDWELKFEASLPPEVPYQHSSCLLDILEHSSCLLDILDDQERRPEALQLEVVGEYVIVDRSLLLFYIKPGGCLLSYPQQKISKWLLFC